MDNFSKQIYEAGINDGRAEGKAEGKAESKKEIAMGMLRNGLDYELIAKCTELSIDYIREIANKNRLI